MLCEWVNHSEQHKSYSILQPLAFSSPRSSIKVNQVLAVARSSVTVRTRQIEAVSVYNSYDRKGRVSIILAGLSSALAVILL